MTLPSVDGIPVTVTYRVLNFSAQGYQKWLKKSLSNRDYENAYLTNAPFDAQHDVPTFGYRFVADELEKACHVVSERRVWRLCSSFVKKGRSGKKPGPPVHDDLAQHDLSATAMNEIWYSDITEHPRSEGKLYLFSLKDAFSMRIVGYSIGDRMAADLAA